jgi:hypothetical protein
MADPKSPQQRAGLLRLITRKSSPPLTEDRAGADDNPLTLRVANDRARAGIAYKGIEQGQRYRAVGRSFSVWEVRDIVNHAGLPVPHVRLIRVGSPKDVKMMSADILRNRRFYKPA